MNTLNKDTPLRRAVRGRGVWKTNGAICKQRRPMAGAVDLTEAQPWEMALMGQLSAQEPQSRQAPALIS